MPWIRASSTSLQTQFSPQKDGVQSVKFCCEPGCLLYNIYAWISSYQGSRERPPPATSPQAPQQPRWNPWTRWSVMRSYSSSFPSGFPVTPAETVLFKWVWTAIGVHQETQLGDCSFLFCFVLFCFPGSLSWRNGWGLSTVRLAGDPLSPQRGPIPYRVEMMLHRRLNSSCDSIWTFKIQTFLDERKGDKLSLLLGPQKAHSSNLKVHGSHLGILKCKFWHRRPGWGLKL